MHKHKNCTYKIIEAFAVIVMHLRTLLHSIYILIVMGHISDYLGVTPSQDISYG